MEKKSGAGITTHFTLRSTSALAEPNDRVWVYHRAGQPCRKCGTRIATRKSGPYARGTYWCPTCQPARSSADGATTTSTSAA